MARIRTLKTILLLSAFFFLLIKNAWAVCTSSYQLPNYVMTLKGGAIYLSDNAAPGSVIYTQQFTVNLGSIQVECSPPEGGHTFDFYTNSLVEAPGFDRVYETNVPGIGIRFYNDSKLLLAPSGLQGDTTARTSWGANASLQLVTVSLIKTSHSISRGVISGNILPVLQYRFVTIPMWRLSFSGSISINTPTCDIAVPNTTVQMGTYNVDVFASNQATDWKDASITLNNCGQFLGRSDPNLTPIYNTDNNTYTNDALIDNVVSVSLHPRDGIVDATEGIFNIIPVVSGRIPSATGVGIQLSSTQSEAGKVNLGLPLKMNLPNDGRPVITIPLYARYIKTEDDVTPGLANGRITYLINYQ